MTPVPRAVDNTDWLKTAAIILVSIDHIGYFFIEDYLWWSVFGRFAAPPFFFLLGYAQTRRVPLSWIWLGVALTLLDSWNTGWAWVAPNILLSLALIRLARPWVQILVRYHDWGAFVLIVSVLLALLPLTGGIVDYGSAGWLWALFGFYQRMWVDSRPVGGMAHAAPKPAPASGKPERNTGLTRLLACLVAMVVYVLQEQREFQFPQLPSAVFVLGAGVLSLVLLLFRRGPSPVQPPEPMAGFLRFTGRHTLEIYAVQLAAFEIIIKLAPGLAP